jgi:hypothetical protein
VGILNGHTGLTQASSGCFSAGIYSLMKNYFTKVLSRKVHCHDLKSSCLPKNLIFFMNSAINVPQFVGKLLGC